MRTIFEICTYVQKSLRLRGKFILNLVKRDIGQLPIGKVAQPSASSVYLIYVNDCRCEDEDEDKNGVEA